MHAVFLRIDRVSGLNFELTFDFFYQSFTIAFSLFTFELVG